MSGGVSALERVDSFVGGLMENLDPGVLLLIASDHGNIEDVQTGHTRNPALGFAAGPGAEAAGRLRDLREVAPFILGVLGLKEC